MSRRKQCGILLAVILVLFLGYSFQKSDRLLKEITDVIGVDVSTGEVLSEEDSHGGFHGGGSTIVEIQFKEDTIVEVMMEQEPRSFLPLRMGIIIFMIGTRKV